jgi:hypothetical protein
MPTSTETPTLVTFRGGFVAEWLVVEWLLDLEARGARFELVDGGRFLVMPPAILTPADRTFLQARRDEARAVIRYYTDEVPA